MKIFSSLLLAYVSFTDESSAFIPQPQVRQHHANQREVQTILYQTDPERKRDKVRSLIVNTANKAASLSKSVLNKGGVPIANVLKETALEGGGIASEKLIEVLNRIEVTLDNVEGEVNMLREELRGIKDGLSSYVSSTAAGEASESIENETNTQENIHLESTAPEMQTANLMAEEETAISQNEINRTGSQGILTADLSTLKYEDIDYTLTDMAPPFINEDECLVPGEPLVRVEKAPQNSRRIFAGIDIPVSVDEVWSLLTDYANLQQVVPNLVVNEVLQIFPGSNDPEPIASIQSELSDAEQCRENANRKKGVILKQVGGAKVVGINFSARTTLEVREWPDVSQTLDLSYLNLLRLFKFKHIHIYVYYRVCRTLPIMKKRFTKGNLDQTVPKRAGIAN